MTGFSNDVQVQFAPFNAAELTGKELDLWRHYVGLIKEWDAMNETYHEWYSRIKHASNGMERIHRRHRATVKSGQKRWKCDRCSGKLND